jgi:uncharacterized protein (TIRG00374 family)
MIPALQSSKWRYGLGWIFGVLVLGAVVGVVLHFGELRQFADLLRAAEPQWLLVAALCQAGTYVCATAVWHRALREGNSPLPLRTIVPLGLVKLFTDQALPSGGISGTLMVIGALGRRGVPHHIGMGALLVGLVSFYAAYVLTVLAAVALMWRNHATNPVLLAGMSLLCVIAVAIPAAVFAARRWARLSQLAWVRRIPGLERLLNLVADAPTDLLRRPRLVAVAVVLQLWIFLLDAITLWVLLAAVGRSVEFGTAFVAFIAATVAATVGPVPLGLGTFEAVSVAMLNQLGVPLEPSLAATLLLRGFTFWLPMLPGLWIARRELRR